MSRPLKVYIHIQALRHNLALVKQMAPNSRVMAVIKANGYGHGMLRVAQALADADGFAVLSLAEALALRSAGFKQALLLLEGFFSADELAEIAARDIWPVIHCERQLCDLEHSHSLPPLRVFLKLNSGMNRLGFRPAQFDPALQRLQQCAAVSHVSLMTHFATADEDIGVSQALSVFRHTTAHLNLDQSLANSAAILRYPETHGDWVRPGIMLYGASPMPALHSAAELSLQAAMSLKSEIIAIQQLQAGECLGYGCAWRADQSTRVGVVACGYADGYPRHAPTGTPILVNGLRTRTLGRVSMDMLFADLNGLPDAAIGSPVSLWGEDLPVDQVATAAGTISYELLCAVTSRVPIVEL
ncbi:MAG: alanine racemase [Sulfuricellaceae bacterium]|nr:alanine racemase [Sulfuricellaceae bacterium]